MATLIAADAGVELARQAEAVAKLLPAAGEFKWLAPDLALDLAFEAASEDLPHLRQAVAAARPKGLALDIVLQPAAGRRKKLLLADMDSTMIGQECIDELADFAGLKPMVAAITERAMRGELAFEPALRERVALLKGLPLGVVDEVLAERITLTPGGRTLVATMKAHGGTCVLVSGGFTLFTAPVAAKLGFDENRGNSLLIENDRLSGFVADPILGREAKLAALHNLRQRLGLSASETLAIGDGANDLGMIGDAGLGLAFHAKPAVAAAAGGRIDHNDLTAVLFIQGYRADEFTGG